MRAILAGLAMVSIATGASAQQAAAPPPVSEAETRLHTDWAWLGRYRDDDASLIASGAKTRVVFIGDSITEGWRDKVPGFFRPGIVGRGIGGQTTPQMLLRFRQDVIALHPAAVHIMAGTNDIAGNTGPMTLAETQGNIMSMAELARATGIKVILASIPPAAAFPWRAGLKPAPAIAAMNAWLADYARRTGATYVDYWSALHEGDAMRADYSRDGVHPEVAGYAVMAPLAEAAIGKALAKR